MYRLSRWWRALGYSLVALLATIPLALAFAALVISLTLCLVGIGLYLVPGAMRLTSGVVGRCRELAASYLRMPTSTAYAHAPADPGWGRARVYLTDAGRWRDVGWALLHLLVLWALPTFVVSGFCVGVASWPLGVAAYGWSPLSGLSVFLVCIGIWLGLVTPLTDLWSRVTAAMLTDTRALQRRLAQEKAARAEQLDSSSAQLERLERDLHDGAQARIAAMGMTLGLAAELTERDPAAAKQLIEEAAASSSRALEDIRAVVQGVRPPVLADRGLLSALEALAVDLPVPVRFTGTVGALPATVETALYFVVAELLSNAVKHSSCTKIDVTVQHTGDTIGVRVRDDGRGGAHITGGGGLMGISRRLAALDGRLVVNSPPGGPSDIEVEIGCASSSEKTTPSSATA